MSLNKTPGLDGIPTEFYIENWDVISNDILVLYNTVLQMGSLTVSQKQGIITIIPKIAGTLFINNFRPISLLCCDYKILAKILCERMKKVLFKIIHDKQFRGVPGRLINQGNIEMRDLFYYANDNNLDIAILNLDWYKAFDLVPVDFVFKILQAFGFGEVFISWVKTLYTGIESALELNNIMSDFSLLIGSYDKVVHSACAFL